ncbi:NAD(P)/FAD-dependent oxidoreductase [Sulfolobus sp. E5-1-F]|uniref:NAD(P)/FAD-dependent oxidoreductase n=1 Tax=Sulfolobaceae TaxID=118883 RepID=UPI001297AFF5|nr:MULTISPECIES: NAD(P)/FAD-dependent oxidoreductase [unclassified Sulfolobus]QGA54663.1 NAD(P)/FAD-dependent oxidoreductase [Sulfolobus sp. E5-1-F]QGA67517.1 NAD(P)/FAD-dependent oxidoreductase [Sulfolobus sp. E11-6]
MVGGGLAGLLLAYNIRDSDPIVFDRRRFPGKKCTGVISRKTFLDLGVSRQFIDREFKVIEIKYDNKYKLYVNTDVIRLNREKLEIWLDEEVKTRRPRDVIINGNTVISGNEKYEGIVVDAGGWKGNAKWIKAIEYLVEPINEENIVVYIHSKNVGGFSWIVPLPYGTLVGAISYSDPRLFLPKINKRILDIHGGAIPRVSPISNIKTLKFGDSTGLIKTFTGGGIFGIASLLHPLVNGIRSGKFNEYYSKYKILAKEIRRQYYITRFLEFTWKTLPVLFKLYNDKTLNVSEEFDLHSLLIRRFPH